MLSAVTGEREKGKSMRCFSVLIILLTLSGCAGTLSARKYTDGNTFISERLPPAEIQVSEGFELADSLDTKIEMTRDIGVNSSSSKVKVFKAQYANEKARAMLIIATMYTVERYWSFLSANFTQFPGTKIVVSEQEINGRRFDTATVQHITGQGIFLQKVYSTLYGEQARLVVQVFQQIDRPMFAAPPYSEEAQQVLANFNALADTSFTIVK